MCKKGKSILTNVKVSMHMLAQIDGAIKDGVSITRSEFIRSAVTEKLDRHEHKKKIQFREVV